MELARLRLREGFAFVGIFEHWALSVCLLHARFGGLCDRAELVNLRPTANASKMGRWRKRYGFTSGRAYTKEGDRGAALFRDPFDTELYDLATARFERELKEHRITPERCASEICPGVPVERFV